MIFIFLYPSLCNLPQIILQSYLKSANWFLDKIAKAIAEGMIWFSTVLMQLSLIGYVLYYIRRLREHEDETASPFTEENE